MFEAMPQPSDAPFSVAFVLGLYADLERQYPPLAAQLATSQRAATSQEAAFIGVQEELTTCNAAVRAEQASASQAARALATANGRLASLHQEVALLVQRLDDLRNKMQGMGDTDAFRQLRRSRAAVGVQLEDRRADLSQVTATAQAARAALETAQKALLQHNDRVRHVRARLHALQAVQPPAALYLDLFANVAGRAHAQLVLDTAAGGGAAALAARWRDELTVAVGYIEALYAGLAAGRYAVEAATSWAGGRAAAVSEALYALVALGDLGQAMDLFAQTTAEDVFFHHIFQTFRGGCVGLFLAGRHSELAEALRLHQYAPGVRGAYVEAFSALLQGDAVQFDASLRQLVVTEWRVWAKSPTPALGLVNLSVLGLLQLGQLRGFGVSASFGPTVPRAVLPG
jgi:hypothetical protein